MIAAQLFAVLLLIVATAFFVATEFALVKIRPSRVDQMALEGRRGAAALRKVLGNLDGYLSACQLGITVTALGLGWLGEDTFEELLHLLFVPLAVPEEVSAVLSVAIAFFVVTFFHVVAGELAPKTLAIRKAETIALGMAPVMIFFYKVMYPLIWLLNGSANGLIRLFGLKPVHEHGETPTEEELRIILNESYKSGMINKNEYSLVNRVFKFDELLAREIMVPRTDMVCLSVDKSLEENVNIVKRERYTRYPVIRESKDNVIGMIHTKEIFLRAREPDFDFRKLIHPILTVPETMPVSELLRRMQYSRSHIAILVDEYGGTSGMVTMEDIVEEIVGEIRDEFDVEESPPVERIDETRLIVDGLVTVDTVEELLGVKLPDEDHDTIGGWLYAMCSELKKGEAWNFGELTFKVLDRSIHRIRKSTASGKSRSPKTRNPVRKRKGAPPTADRRGMGGGRARRRAVRTVYGKSIDDGKKADRQDAKHWQDARHRQDTGKMQDREKTALPRFHQNGKGVEILADHRDQLKPTGPTTAVGNEAGRRRGLIVSLLLSASFVCLLNQTLLIVAIPPIMNEFGIQPNQGQWITTAFMLMNGIMIPVTAFLIEKFGNRTLLIFALGVFSAGTLLGAVAPGFSVLLLARIAQAMGAGIMMPLMQTVLLILYPPEKRGAAMGMSGLVIGFAPAIGPTLGGWLIGHGSWRFLFYTVLPIALVVLVAAIALMKNVIERKPRTVDPLSILLSSIGWGGLLYGFSMAGTAGWGDAGVIGSLAAGALSLTLFIRRQLAMETPMLNFRVFRYPVFALSTLLAVFMFAVLIGTETLLPIYVQNIRGGTALESGLMLLPGALTTGLMAPVSGRLYDRYGARGMAIAGFALMVTGTLLLINIDMDMKFPLISLMYLVMMFGVSLLMTPLMTAGINALPLNWIAHGTAMNNTIRMVGGSIGTALMVSMMSKATGLSQAASPAAAGLTGIKAGLATAAVMVLAGLVMSFFLRERVKKRELAVE